MSFLFWAEILLGVVLPLLFFSFQQGPPKPQGIIHWRNCSAAGDDPEPLQCELVRCHPPRPDHLYAHIYGPGHYFPSLPEVALSIGIFSAGILAFGLAVKYLPVFEAVSGEEENPRDRLVNFSAICDLLSPESRVNRSGKRGGF